MAVGPVAENVSFPRRVAKPNAGRKTDVFRYAEPVFEGRGYPRLT